MDRATRVQAAHLTVKPEAECGKLKNCAAYNDLMIACGHAEQFGKGEGNHNHFFFQIFYLFIYLFIFL